MYAVRININIPFPKMIFGKFTSLDPISYLIIYYKHFAQYKY